MKTIWGILEWLFRSFLCGIVFLTIIKFGSKLIIFLDDLLGNILGDIVFILFVGGIINHFVFKYIIKGDCIEE